MSLVDEKPKAKPMPAERRAGELPPMDSLQNLRFVRMADIQDTHGNRHASLWLDADERTIWLAPEGVIQAGLSDKLREGVQRHMDEGVTQEALELGRPVATPGPRPQDAGTWFAEQGAQAHQVKLREGRTDDWRWWCIQTDEGEVVVIDNRPLIDRQTRDLQPTAALVQVILPSNLLDLIARGS